MDKTRLIPLLAGCCALALSACGAQQDAGTAAASTPAQDTAPAQETSRYVNWDSYEGGQTAAHFAPLDQINRDNVHQLEKVWEYSLGEGTAAANPVIVDGVMYVIGNGGAIIAVDAVSGEELWVREGVTSGRSRGLMFWSGEDQKRIFFTQNNMLLAIDAATGEDIEGFGADLKLGLDRDPKTIRNVQSSTPGRVFEDLVILGSSPGENYGSPPGDIRAYDALTGELVWTFHTIPKADDPVVETWGPNPRERHGGANAWGGMSIDEERGILFANTGSATYDYWGVDRPGDNLYADSLLALDARTGERLWHFQIVHHDLWDYEASATPTLMTIEKDGAPLDIVAVAGKTGFLYVFERETGEPVWPIEETPVPTDGGMEGEQISPTQPIPSHPEPFARMSFDVDDIDVAIEEPERSEWVKRVREARNDGIFTPPSTTPTIQVPGNNGGANFGMTGADLENGRFYVISAAMPSILQLELIGELEVAGASAYERGQNIYQSYCATCHGADRAGQPPAIPSLIGVRDRMNFEELQSIITEGKPPMPGFPYIAGWSYWDLLTYLSGDENAEIDTEVVDAAPPPKVEERWRTDYGYVYTAGTDRPVINPPWSTMTAYDMHSGDKIWSTTIGHDPEYPIEGVKTGLPLPKLGPLLTKGGLVFVATMLDRQFEAYDAETGELVWSDDLPASALSFPASYAVDGRQYIVVPATASGQRSSKETDSAPPANNAYVVYALPQGEAP